MLLYEQKHSLTYATKRKSQSNIGRLYRQAGTFQFYFACLSRISTQILSHNEPFIDLCVTFEIYLVQGSAPVELRNVPWKPTVFC